MRLRKLKRLGLQCTKCSFPLGSEVDTDVFRLGKCDDAEVKHTANWEV